MATTLTNGMYLLGSGDFNVRLGPPVVDEPWTTGPTGRGLGADCAGFAICYCWKLKRHRLGYNRGSWASVEDDINCNSLLEDAQHRQELAVIAKDAPRPGDLLVYPTIRISSNAHNTLTFIGHVGIVENNRLLTAWDPSNPRYDLLSVIQCHGPDGFRPGVVRSDGSIWARHNINWPKPEHRAYVVRMKERD
jgi:hypothetical protein